MISTIKICQQNNGERAEKLKNRMHANFTFYKFLTIVDIVVTIEFLYYPLYSYIFHGKLVPALPVEVMFVDQSTSSGFLITCIIQALLGVYSITQIVYMRYCFIYAIMNYTIRVDIADIDFNELDELWRDTSKSTLSYRNMLLKNICQKYNDMR